jgi:hypothetical protein
MPMSKTLEMKGTRHPQSINACSETDEVVSFIEGLSHFIVMHPW